MRRFIAICGVVFLLAGCAQKASFENLAYGKCAGAVADSVNKHVAGQIDALAENEWELAHSFASENFQSNVSIEDFALIISAQYPMLIKNTGYQFNECTVAGSTITQEVSVTSGEQVFNLAYKLTVNGSILGIESAVISKVASRVNA